MIFNFLIVFSTGENGHETGLKIKCSGCIYTLFYSYWSYGDGSKGVKDSVV